MAYKVKVFSSKGSTVTTYDVVEEAEKVINAARKRGGFIVQDSTQEVVHSGEPIVEEEVYSVIPAIAGG